jgi:hypothetical protein
MAKSLCRPGARAIGLLLAIGFRSVAALADAPTTVSTTLAVETAPRTPTATVSADKFKQPLSQMTLSVFLGSIPANAELDSCALRLVTATPVPEAQYNGVAVQLFDATKDPKSARSIAQRTVGAGSGAGTVVELKTDGLCRDLMEKIPAPQTAQLRLQTTIAGAAIGFYGRAADVTAVDPSAAPRLLLTYELPNSRPGRADWSQARRDAQQSGQSPWRIYNPKDAYVPGGFRMRHVGKETFADVSPPLLLYNRDLVAVSGESNVQFMDGDGTVLRTVALDLKPKFTGVSQQGWLYATGEHRIVMQPVDGQARTTIDIGSEETVLDPPTIGADGSLYFATNTYIYAYPAPPVPASLANVPLWRVRTAGESNYDVSTIALSADERTAYFVFVDKQTGSLVALDAATGLERWRRGGLTIDRGRGKPMPPMPLPVVADGTVFVTNKAPMGSALYIIDGAKGDLLDTIKGTDIAAPVAGPKGSVFYSRDASNDPGPDPRNRRNLRQLRLAGGKFEEVGADDGCQNVKADLLRTDLSGNVYILDRAAKVFGFSPASGAKCVRVASADLVSLAVAADGSIFGVDRMQQLQTVTAELGEKLALSNQILKLNQDGTAVVENNDTTFRAAEVTSESGLFLPANTNINIVAAEGVVFRSGLRIAAGARLHIKVGN